MPQSLPELSPGMPWPAAAYGSPSCGSSTWVECCGTFTTRYGRFAQLKTWILSVHCHQSPNQEEADKALHDQTRTQTLHHLKGNGDVFTMNLVTIRGHAPRTNSLYWLFCQQFLFIACLYSNPANLVPVHAHTRIVYTHHILVYTHTLPPFHFSPCTPT